MVLLKYLKIQLDLKIILLDFFIDPKLFSHLYPVKLLRN